MKMYYFTRPTPPEEGDPDTHPTYAVDTISNDLRAIAHCNPAKAKVLQTELANLKI